MSEKRNGVGSGRRRKSSRTSRRLDILYKIIITIKPRSFMDTVSFMFHMKKPPMARKAAVPQITQMEEGRI
jgi:hypothetical protein